ncbi:MAG: iron-sulfur [Geobacteraceae bacterium]|nr:MAG: iron-sulfur [Geobacteraceae bacterium]
MAKIVGLSGSPRPEGNTDILVKEALKAAAALGLETEFVTLAGKDIQPCRACYGCREEGAQGKCAIDDDLPAIFERLKGADGIIIGSPVYFLSVTAQLKALFDRGLVLRYGKGRVKSRPGVRGGPEFLLTGKVGGAIAVAGSNGQQLTSLDILKWMIFQNMLVVGNGVDVGTNVSARGKGEVLKDKTALFHARSTGVRVAETVKALQRQ